LRPPPDVAIPSPPRICTAGTNGSSVAITCHTTHLRS
jgi:hypothetical protein